MEANQVLEWPDKDFKPVIINLFKQLKNLLKANGK